MDRLKLPIVILIVGLGVCFYLVSKVMDNNVKVIELVKESQQTTQLEPKPEEVPKENVPELKVGVHSEPAPKLKQDLNFGDGATSITEMNDEEWCRDWYKEREAWESKAAFEDSIDFYNGKIEYAERKSHVYEKDYNRCNRMLKAAEAADMPEDSEYLRHLREDCKSAFKYHPDMVKSYKKWVEERKVFLKSLRKGLEAQQ